MCELPSHTGLLKNIHTDTHMYVCTCKAWQDEQDWVRWVVETGLGDVFPVQGNLPTILQHNKLSDKKEVAGG